MPKKKPAVKMDKKRRRMTLPRDSLGNAEAGSGGRKVGNAGTLVTIIVPRPTGT